MKKAIGWLLSWTLFWMGDAFSKLLHVPDGFPEWWFSFFYRIYNRLMWWSSDMQDWGGSGPWEPLGNGGI